MINKVLDLHGLTEQEVISLVLLELYSFEIGSYYTLEIITGKGDVLSRVVEEILEEENYSWKHLNNNSGSYFVLK